MPRCFFADICEFTGTYVLLLEYVQDGVFKNPVEPTQKLSLEDANLIMDLLAKLHCSYWGRDLATTTPALHQVSKLDRPEYGLFPGAVREHYPKVLAKSCG